MNTKKQIGTLIFAGGLALLTAQDASLPQAEAPTNLDLVQANPDTAPIGDSAESFAAEETDVTAVDAGQVKTTEVLAPPPEELSDANVISNLFTGYISALGGERKLRKIKSRIVKGTLEYDETKADFELNQSAEGHFLNVMQFPGNTKQVGFDGDVAWEQSGDARWTPLSVEDAANEKFLGSLVGFLDWQSFYSKTSLLPDVEINGRPVKVVLAEKESGVEQKIFFDEQSFRVVRVDEETRFGDSGLVLAERYFKDYRTVDGVVVPFLEETIFPTMTLTKRVRSVEQNVELKDGSFSPPPAGGLNKAGARDTERYFDSLTVGGIVYTNVWVHRQTNYNVLIRHSHGIHTIRLTDLPQGDLDELRPQLGDLANIEENNNIVTDKWDELAGDAELQAMFRDKANMATEMVALVLIPFIIGWIVAHLIWSYIIKRLCDKTETKGGLAVWLPVVQLVPMFRAAGFSDKWLMSAVLLILLPILLVLGATLSGVEVEPGSVAMMIAGALALIGSLILTIASIMWPFKICSRCQMSPFLGLLMFVPVANVGVILYLAFSKQE